MRASRLLSLLILLQLRPRITAEALAAEFGVSVRTIYRDIDELSASGIPVYGDRGPGGGFQLMQGYQTRLTGLAADEAEAMLMIGLPGPADALGLGSAASRARGKLLAALPAGASADADRIGSRFHLDTVDWYQASDPAPHLPAIARAVLDQRQVTMKYQSWKATRDWLIEPLGLVLKGASWYVAARGAGKVRIFKVANILEQQVREEGFERPADFNLAAYWTAELQRFEAGLRPTQALLRASTEGLVRLAKLGAYAVQATRRAEPADAEGWARLRFPIEHVDQAALALLGVGPEVEVLEPVELRVRLRDLAQQIARRAATKKAGR